MAEQMLSVPIIDRVIELQPARTLDIEGYTYIDKDRTATLFQPPVPTPITLHTLSGFVGLLESGFEGFSPAATIIHVDVFDEVSLLASASDKWGRRQKYVSAKALKPDRTFNFGVFISQEEFNIALRSMFVQTSELDALVSLAGNIAAKTEVHQEDDGFAQRVTAKNGVHMVREVTVKPRVTLQPFRTFLEVEQPKGDFIFRVKHDEGRGNLCALFEADAGAWKLTAMNSIKEWLTNATRGSVVVGLNNTPVVA